MLIHFSLTLFLCLLNLIKFKPNIHKNFILPFSFLLIGLFMGLRFDYGLDYWNYYDIFVSQKNDYRPEEFLFWKFFFSFSKYYQFILVKSLLLAGLVFYMTRQYVPQKYYFLFIFFFMTNPSLIYTLITAERTCVGAMVLWIGIEFFYFRKKRILPLISTIIIAGFFHTILFSMLIIPFFDFIYQRQSLFIIAALIIALILGMIITPYLFGIITSEMEVFTQYEHYAEGRRFGVDNFIGFLYKALLLLPIYIILIPIQTMHKNSQYVKLVVLSLCYMFLYFIGLESDGRFGSILLLFFVILLAQRAEMLKKKTDKLLLILPFVFITLFNSHNLYKRMLHDSWLPGNYITYRTIIEEGFYE